MPAFLSGCSVCGIVQKGTSNSEAVVCRKFSRREQERQDLVISFPLFFDYIADVDEAITEQRTLMRWDQLTGYSAASWKTK